VGSLEIRLINIVHVHTVVLYSTINKNRKIYQCTYSMGEMEKLKHGLKRRLK